MKRRNLKNHGRTEHRPHSRHPRHAHPQDSEPRAAAWFWHHQADRADLARGVQGQPWIAPHRTAAAGAGWLARLRMAPDRELPPREVLLAHALRKETARDRA